MTEMNDTWKVMDDLETSFSNITTFNFMLEQLQEAVDNGMMDEIVDLTHALNAFMPVYTNNWDRKFKVAWEHVVKISGYTEARHEASDELSITIGD